MTALADYLSAHGHTLIPLDDPSLTQRVPGGGWQPVPRGEAVENVAVWTDPGLGRTGFQPTVILSTARISPAVDENAVLDRLDDTAASLDAWHLRAARRDVDDRGRTVSDTLGECRSGEHSITVSTIATVWEDDGTTILRQLVVTTFTDQLALHSDVLRALS